MIAVVVVVGMVQVVVVAVVVVLVATLAAWSRLVVLVGLRRSGSGQPKLQGGCW